MKMREQGNYRIHYIIYNFEFIYISTYYGPNSVEKIRIN